MSEQSLTAAPARDLHGTAVHFIDRNALPLTLFVAFATGCLVVVGVAQSFDAMRVAPALLWSLAFGATGILIGFIFAIPRVPSTSNAGRLPTVGGVTAPTPAATDEASRAADQQASGNEVNSNLVEVSDWLTKIIVGVGLVEAKSLPSYADRLAHFVAPSLFIADELATPVVGGIMLYFSVLGFLAGYLLTRVYIAVMFKSADVMIHSQGQVLRLESGREIDSGKLALLQQKAIEDVQRALASLPAEQLRDETAMVSGSPSAAAKRVLWVDDHPDNNTLLVEQLTHAGLVVEQVLSTESALQHIIASPVDLVISDMARDEGAGNVEDAGVQLARAIRAKDSRMPVLVYCSSAMVRKHGAAAEKAGALLVTSSGTRLLAQIQKMLGTV